MNDEIEHIIPLKEFQELISSNTEQIEQEKLIDKLIDSMKYAEAYVLLKKDHKISISKKKIFRDVCATHGVDEAQYDFVLDYLNSGKDSDMPFVYLTRLCKNDYVSAYYYLAVCYINGYGCDKNPNIAIELLLKSFVFNSYPVENLYLHFENLLSRYSDVEKGRNEFYGIGCEQNYNLAFHYLASSFIYYRDPYVGCMLADMFLSGTGVAINKSVALELYKRCLYLDSDYNYEDYYERKAELKIGMSLYDGVGTVRNRELATYFLGEVEEFYKKIDNPIPERYADEINTAINLANSLFREFGHDYAEEAEAWLDTKKEYAIP
ncbi:tetratricopeptide repeat protein [Pseudobutyrivibrio sp.]|uniref:tetratricopeptide repeat protein n=1 Tax=Pseudobutyrivibrio sp. TaxID=2014367 RepID=UPI0025E5CFE9|nr:hypothetical protein [Pseudobutyrivibrio sp.]MBR5650072.1 sel1 repeat family protein [Pseudobutyrivibrio sp.]